MGTRKKINFGSSKSWFIYIVLFYFFIFRDYLENVVAVAQYVDEFVAALAIPLFVIELRNNNFKIKIRREGYAIWLIVFVITGLLGNVIYHYQPLFQAALPDFFLNLKFWLAIYTGSWAYRNFSVEKYSERMFAHIKFITWLFTILIVTSWLFKIFPAEVRYGIRSTQLFFSHSTVMAAISTYIIALLMSIREHTGKKGNIYFVWWLVILCSTMRSKAWGAAMAFVLIYYFTYVRKKKIQVRTLLLFVPLIGLLGWNQIEYYFFSDIQSGSARYQLLNKSFMIMRDYFPIGTGFGTYASHYSAVIYSPLYAMYGISHIQGLTQEDASFVSDSFWPMIFAQTGVIGTLAFVMVIWKLYKKIQSVRIYSKAYYVSAFCILAYVLISSMAESAFSHTLMIPMALWLGYLLQDWKKKDVIRC